MDRRRIEQSQSELAQAGREIFSDTVRRTEEFVEQTLGDTSLPRRPAPIGAEAGAAPEREARRRALRQMLASREALRNAILVSEILGPPKGLRS